jgi:NAD-dependent dihydropyrimidine dehydrogenase PreA subunit
MLNSYTSNTLQYDPDLCVNCGMCSMVCPHGVFASDEGVARLVNREACMECGACQHNCPTSAITVDSGVGCAAAMIRAALTGKKEATCTCGPASGSPCCGGDEKAASCCD